MWGKIATLGLKVAVPFVAEKIFRRKPKAQLATDLVVQAFLDQVQSDDQTETERVLRSIVGHLPNNNRSEMELSSILPLAQTLLSSVTGGKSAALVAGTEYEFRAASKAAVEVSEVLDACADAVADGNVSWEEIQRILAEAQDVPAAISAIKEPKAAS